MSKFEFATCLAPLEAAVNQSLTEQQAAVWYDVLQDLPVEALKTAVKRVLCEREYPGLPPVATLRRLATEQVHGIPVSPEHAFSWLRTNIYRIRPMPSDQARSVCGPVLSGVIDFLGGREAVSWLVRDETLNDAWPRFRDAYQRLASQQQLQQLTPEPIRPRLTMEGSNRDATQNVRRIDGPCHVSELFNGARH